MQDNFLEVEFLGQGVCAFLFLKGLAKVSFREVISIYILLAMDHSFYIIYIYLVTNYFNIISDINEYSVIDLSSKIALGLRQIASWFAPVTSRGIEKHGVR